MPDKPTHDRAAPDRTVPGKVIAYLGLGSNLGDRASNLKYALDHLSAMAGTEILQRSSVYETEPLPAADQENFFNLVVKVETNLGPYQLLGEINKIEANMGRVRLERNESRIIDIDILVFGEQHIKDKDLMIPHPLIAERAFVLFPLIEITERSFVINGVSLAEMLDNVHGQKIEIANIKFEN